jgi:class 3 adenylate cyclase
MRAWTVDADDIQIAGDFDAGLLHRTPPIEDFLAQSRDTKFIVVATKGFGKTLLLKAKRVLYQEAGRLCIPQNALLDKPIGDKVFRREMVDMLGRSTEPWTKLWRTAIAVATLKQLHMVERLAVNPRLHALVEDDSLRGVIDVFVNLLDLPRSDLYRCANDTETRLIPRLRSISRPVAIFIDGVDEYFNKHLQSPTSSSGDSGELSPNIWHYSQMALVEVAYQLHRICHHLKVFAAIRKEAFARLADATAMAQQYRGSVVDIDYAEAGLREIFSNNVRQERDKNLVRRAELATAPIAAFLGRTQIVHTYTGEAEDAFDYIRRHTLHRPRDLMTIGQKLSALGPEERVSELRVKSAVNAAATEIAQEYLNEIAPYVGDVDLPTLFRLLPGHIVTEAELRQVTEQYDAMAIEDERAIGTGAGALFILHKAGLLGWIQTDHVSGTAVQRFRLPGEEILDGEGALPPSSHYLLHPTLTEVIGRNNPDYARRIDTVNIVGWGRPWRDAPAAAARPEERRCVLKADIHRFSRFVDEPLAERAVREAWRLAVTTHGAGCLASEVAAGDSCLIVDDDANAIVRIALRLQQDVFDAPGNPQLRIALHHGPVQLERDDDGTAKLVGGSAVQLAARIEPHVRPGEIWATEAFRTRLEAGPTLYAATEIPRAPTERAEEPAGSEGMFNVKKAGSLEPDIWVHLFRIGPRTG